MVNKRGREEASSGARRATKFFFEFYALLATQFFLHIEAGLDPRGHLLVTPGVYLCPGKPPLADIILLHPCDLT